MPGLLRDLRQAIDHAKVLRQILALEARAPPPEVTFRQLVQGTQLPRQEAASERAEGDESNAQLSAGREDPVLRVAGPERVFALNGRDRVDRMRAP